MDRKTNGIKMSREEMLKEVRKNFTVCDDMEDDDMKDYDFENDPI